MNKLMFDVITWSNKKHEVVLKDPITNKVYEKFGTYRDVLEAEHVADSLEEHSTQFRENLV